MLFKEENDYGQNLFCNIIRQCLLFGESLRKLEGNFISVFLKEWTGKERYNSADIKFYTVG